MSRLDSQAIPSMDFPYSACYSKHMGKPLFRDVLRKAMERAGVGQRELSRRSGKNISTVSFTLKGKTWGDKYPPLDDIEAYAKALEIDAAILRGDKPFPDEPDFEEVPEIQTIPLAELLGRVGARPVYGEYVEGLKLSAGPGAKVPQGFDESRPRKGKNKEVERIQIIEVEGHCMENVLHPGDKVLVDTQRMPSIGEITAAVRFHHDSIVKFLREKDGRQYFEGRDGTIVPFDQYTRILGPVVDVQRSIWRVISEAE